MSTCKDCNKEFQLSDRTIKYRENNNLSTDICKDCLRKIKSEKQSIFLKHQWGLRTEKERKCITQPMIDGIKKYWEDEDNILISSIRQRERLGNMTNEEKKNWKNKISESHKIRYINSSEEEKEKIAEKLHDMNKNYYNNTTFVDRQNKMKKLLLGYYINLEDNEKKGLSFKLSTDDIQKFTDNDFSIINSYMSKNCWDKLDKDEKNSQIEKRIESTIKNKKCKNKLETYFQNLLHLLYWGNPTFEYDHLYLNDIKHPDFDKLFPINPVTGSKFVYPFHTWDFRIHLKNKILDSDFYIDIDGSRHDLSKQNFEVTYYDGTKFILSDLIKFNDSQRQYQTDELNAYIIKCYDDELTLDTPVLSIKTNNTKTVGYLLEVISEKLNHF